ncbi:MAG: 50S ribosomal protein L9 [Bacteroidia bacterium]|nr:50S ribosomal protein L9 [Bacteroidia bacterium]
MEIILKQPVKNLGDTHDIVKVKPGYARNFLIPTGMAVIANASNRKAVEEIKRQVAHKQEHIKTQAEKIAAQLADMTIEIETLAGADEKLFGSVTTLQIAAKLKEKGLEIDRKIITVDDIRELGTYSATVHLHKEVKADLAINVVRKAN